MQKKGKDYEKKEASGEFDEDPAPDQQENEPVNFDDLDEVLEQLVIT